MATGIDLDHSQPTVSEADLRHTIATTLRRWPSAGLAVAVVRAGAPPRSSATAWPTFRPAVDVDTVFRIGSLTKVITAVAVMQLCEQGLIDLDAPADEYLRAFRLVAAKADFRPATVRHLLTHTAGVGYCRRRSDLLRQNPWRWATGAMVAGAAATAVQRVRASGGSERPSRIRRTWRR